MVDATHGAVTDQTDEPLSLLEDAPGPPGRGGVDRNSTPEDFFFMPGAPHEPDDRTPGPDPDDTGTTDDADTTDDIDGPDRRDVAMLGGAGPILAILAMALLALLAVQLTAHR